MKTKRDGLSRAFDRYSADEIGTILSAIPTRENVRRLAVVLGRSQEAVAVVYRLAYTTHWPKAWESTPNNLLRLITRHKRRSGMFIGYLIKKIS